MENLKTVLFTGVSGGGKSTALRAVEDLGFYCVDNLPLPLLGEFLSTMKAEPSVDRVALVVDTRLRSYLEGYALAATMLKASGHLMEIVYLDASDVVLIKRFSQTRRRHPLGGDDLRDGLQKERELLAPLKDHASTCIDTSDLTVHELKKIIQDTYQQGEGHLIVSVVSFGFRYGIPTHADLVFDVRFLPNPYFLEEMRELTGLDERVARFVLEKEDSQTFLDQIDRMLSFLMPRYEQEGKVYLTVAIGCTGGQHRSVAVAEELGKRLSKWQVVRVRHRDMEKQ